MLIVFKLFLLLSLVGLAYLFLFRIQSRLLHRLAVVAFGLSLSLFIVFPDWSTRVASFFGIGRGTDFILYLSQVVAYFFILIQYIQIQKLQENVTTLTRALALQQSNKPSEIPGR